MSVFILPTVYIKFYCLDPHLFSTMKIDITNKSTFKVFEEIFWQQLVSKRIYGA